MRSAFRQPSRVAWLAALAAVLMLALAGKAAATALSPRPSGAGVTVVGYRSERALQRALSASGGRVVRRIRALHVAVVESPPRALQLLSGVPGIRYAEQPVYRRELVDPGLAPEPVPGGAYEWEYAAARENLVPATVLHAASAITIAVLDTGADLSAHDLAAKSPTTWSVRSGSTDVTDYQGHGTFVASLAAGSPSNGEGIAGFGGEAELLAVQAAAPDGTISDVDESAAIVYAVDHGAKIINMSFGGPFSSATEQSAVAYAAAHDVLLVAAAGNSGQSGNFPSYPAALLQPVGSNGQGGVGLAVAATRLDGSRAAFSNYGSYISLAAPGEKVLGALSSASDPAGWPRQALPGSSAGLYGYASGTSFSSPEVAGAAALVWAANPAQRATDVADILKRSATGSGTWNEQTGYGNLDVAAAVARAEGTTVVAPKVELHGARSGLRLSLSWSSPGAVSYRVFFSRDNGPPQVLVGSTTATRATYELEPGHSYSFTVAATDAYGRTIESPPYVAVLPAAVVKLELRVSSKAGAKRLTGIFISAGETIGRRGRKLVLESLGGRSWRRLAIATTSTSGLATWRLRLRRGTYRLRVRYAGGTDLQAATSRVVTILIR
jgi:subtilisin family serine protease